MTTKTTRPSYHLASALVLGMAFLAAPAMAQEKHPVPIIGVVDTDLLLQDSLAAKGVRLERDKYATSYQTQIKDMEAKLRTEDQELSQQRSVMAPDVFQQRAQAFQQKLADFQALVKDKQERLDASFQQSMQEIGNTIMLVSSEIAKQQGINAVMARNQLMIFDPGMDITKPVLEKLNQRLTTVKFVDPSTLPVEGAPPGGAAQAKPALPPAKK